MPRRVGTHLSEDDRCRSSRSLTPGFRATFCEVCRSIGDVRGRRLDCDRGAAVSGVFRPAKGSIYSPGLDSRCINSENTVKSEDFKDDKIFPPDPE